LEVGPALGGEQAASVLGLVARGDADAALAGEAVAAGVGVAGLAGARAPEVAEIGVGGASVDHRLAGEMVGAAEEQQQGGESIHG